MSLRATQKRLEQNKSVCKLSTIYLSFVKDDQSVFDEWISSKKPSGWIARVLLLEGHSVGEKTVKRHLDGFCSCSEGTKYKGVYRGA